MLVFMIIDDVDLSSCENMLVVVLLVVLACLAISFCFVSSLCLLLNFVG